MLNALLVILNIFFIEVMLSVDNVSVLAILVKDLPEDQKTKALRYGILGAFLFRGVSLFLATWLVRIWFLKLAGGLYLLYLTYKYFKGNSDEACEEKQPNKVMDWLGLFWSTVILVELMDMTFSMDNIFAASAISNNIYFILAGVFAGIVAMRFVASWFIFLMEKFPKLETAAFVVIGLLGAKLCVTAIPSGPVANLTGASFDFYFSSAMMLIFLIPILYSLRPKI